MSYVSLRVLDPNSASALFPGLASQAKSTFSFIFRYVQRTDVGQEAVTSQKVAKTALEKWLSDNHETPPVPPNCKAFTK